MHLNTVNSIHSIFQSMIRYYRGVATKYLNRYRALFIFLRKYAGMDDNEMMHLIKHQVKIKKFFVKINISQKAT